TTMLVLVFMWTWNEFLLALVMIQSDSLRTAPLGLALFAGANRGTLHITLVAAAAVLVALPVMIVYVFLQRSFIRAMFAGAVNEGAGGWASTAATRNRSLPSQAPTGSRGAWAAPAPRTSTTRRRRSAGSTRWWRPRGRGSRRPEWPRKRSAPRRSASPAPTGPRTS